MRSLCLAVLLLVTLAAARPARAERSGGEVVLLVLTATGAQPRLRTSEILAAADRALAARADLTLLSPEQAGADLAAVTGCPEPTRLSCWTRTLREAGGDRPLRYLVVVAVHAEPSGADRVSSLLIDAAAALAEWSGASRDAPGWEEAVENRIFERAVRAQTELATIAARGDLDAYFARLFAHLAPTQGQPCVSGLPCAEPPAGVCPRSRESETVVCPPSSEPPGEPSATRTAVVVGGAAVGVIGAGVAIAAALAGPGLITARPCRSGACDEPPAQLYGWCNVTRDDPSRACDGKGILLGPLGYSLVAAGALASLGALFVGEPDEPPWLAIAAGVVAGGLAYGISALADPSTP